MDTEKLHNFLEICSKIDALNRELDTLKNEKSLLDAQIQDNFIADGVDRITVNGRTIFIQSQIWAKYGKGNKQKVIDALKNCDETKDLVQHNFNSQSLSSWVREKVAEWEALDPKERPESPFPPGIAGVIDYSEKTVVKATAA